MTNYHRAVHRAAIAAALIVAAFLALPVRAEGHGGTNEVLYLVVLQPNRSGGGERARQGRFGGWPGKDPDFKHHKGEIKAMLDRALRVAKRLPKKAYEEALRQAREIGSEVGLKY